MLILAAVWSCTEEVDISSRYVFREKTIMDYLDSHEQYSEYARLLGLVPVSKASETTLRQLLSARGHYTVFAPTNDAIQAFLDTLYAQGLIASPSWEGFPSEHKRDSMEKVIVYNSIIDGGDEILYHTYDFPVRQDAEIPTANMYDRKLTVHYPEEDSIIGRIQICGASLDERNRDIILLNGVMHAAHGVVRPSDNTLGQLLFDIVEKRREGFYVAAQLVQAVGLIDSLLQYQDEAYERTYLSGQLPVFVRPTAGTINDFYTPEHRYYGYTFFAETDSLWSALLGKEPLQITVDDVVDYLNAQGIYPDAARDRNYHSEDNLLNRFVTYHLLPERLTTDRLVLHYNEVGYNASDGRLGVPMSEYYTSMGKRRLMKLYESAESGGVFINRFPVLDSGRRGTYHELSCPSDGEGVRIGAALTGQAGNLSNAMVYPLDELLVYDQRLQEKLGSERIRFDAAAMFPELTNNDVRLGTARYTYFPPDRDYKYLDDAWVGEGSMLGYNTGGTYSEKGFITYYGDEMASQGFTDVIFRLPPVPREGLYEIRYGITAADSNRGIYQFYWGSSPDRLRPMGIPLDLRMGGLYFDTPNGTYPSNMGWQEDTDDEDYNSEIDKFLRNHGFMKGANIYSTGETTTGRSVQSQVRRIIVREYMKPDETYYIRFKSCLDYLDRYLVLDYMEYCPKEVYDNPETPEDIW